MATVQPKEGQRWADFVLEQYYKHGQSVYETARALNRSTQAIYTQLAKFDLFDADPFSLTAEQTANFERLIEQYSLPGVAAILNVRYANLRRWALKHGYKPGIDRSGGRVQWRWHKSGGR